LAKEELKGSLLVIGGGEREWRFFHLFGKKEKMGRGAALFGTGILSPLERGIRRVH